MRVHLQHVSASLAARCRRRLEVVQDGGPKGEGPDDGSYHLEGLKGVREGRAFAQGALGAQIGAGVFSLSLREAKEAGKLGRRSDQ